jgi:hypothetical protein
VQFLEEEKRFHTAWTQSEHLRHLSQVASQYVGLTTSWCKRDLVLICINADRRLEEATVAIPKTPHY